MDEAFLSYSDEFTARYTSAGLWGAKPIAQEFAAVAAKFKARPAVADPSRTLTFEDLDQRSDQIASGLLDVGLIPGDKVVLQVGNTASTIEAWYGLLKAGLVPICALDRHGHHEIDALAAMSGAKAHLVDAGINARDLVTFASEVADAVPSVSHLLTLRADPTAPGTRIEDLAESASPDVAAATVKEVQVALDPHDLAVLQLSGGTTGRPRLIPRLHAEYWYNARATAKRAGFSPEDRVAHVLPVVHNAGIHGAVHAAHSVGSMLLVASADPRVFLPFLAEYRPTHLLLVPGFAASLLEDHRFVPVAVGLTRLTLAAAAVPPGLFERLSELGIKVFQQFGMGEGLCMLMPPDTPVKLRSTTVGYPISEMDEVRVVDSDSEQDVEHGQTGELWVRGPYTIRSYYNDAEASTERFSSDGFFRSGDLVAAVRVGEEDWYRIVGRLKDVINRGGEKISPVEVELLLAEHPAIAAVAVVGVPDERLGEKGCACVVTHADHSFEFEDMRAFLEKRGLARYKWPEEMALFAQLPVTPVGKVSKIALQAELRTRVNASSK